MNEKTKGKYISEGDKMMIDQILGWVHVGSSYRKAIKEVIGKVNKKMYWGLPKEHRKEAMAYIVFRHGVNRADYRWVMGSH